MIGTYPALSCWEEAERARPQGAMISTYYLAGGVSISVKN